MNVGSLYGIGYGDGYIFANGYTGVAIIDVSTNAVVKTIAYQTLVAGQSNVEVRGGGRAYVTAGNGVGIIDYEAGKMEELLLESGECKWARALPNGDVVVGIYCIPVMFVIN